MIGSFLPLNSFSFFEMGKFDYKTLLKRVREDTTIRRVESAERFTIPEADVLYEGRTTIIRNFEKICSNLNRDAQHLLKFLLKELGTAGELNGSRALLQGKIPSIQIQNRIREYVETYVLCQECGRPDTHLVKKDRLLLLRCDACGAVRSVSTRKRKIIHKPGEEIKEGDICEVTITDIGSKGDGLAHFGKYTIYVPSAVKGARVRVKIERVSGNIAFGRIIPS